MFNLDSAMVGSGRWNSSLSYLQGRPMCSFLLVTSLWRNPCWKRPFFLFRSQTHLLIPELRLRDGVECNCPNFDARVVLLLDWASCLPDIIAPLISFWERQNLNYGLFCDSGLLLTWLANNFVNLESGHLILSLELAIGFVFFGHIDLERVLLRIHPGVVAWTRSQILLSLAETCWWGDFLVLMSFRLPFLLLFEGCSAFDNELVLLLNSFRWLWILCSFDILDFSGSGVYWIVGEWRGRITCDRNHSRSCRCWLRSLSQCVGCLPQSLQLCLWIDQHQSKLFFLFRACGLNSGFFETLTAFLVPWSQNWFDLPRRKQVNRFPFHILWPCRFQSTLNKVLAFMYSLHNLPQVHNDTRKCAVC